MWKDYKGILETTIAVTCSNNISRRHSNDIVADSHNVSEISIDQKSTTGSRRKRQAAA